MPDTLNPEQVKAITFGDGPLLIIAGAGTGKTTVITQRILHLIQTRHVPPESILALTFTEKAAKEMQERVDIALPYGYSDMWISTFHAFCDRVLRDEALHIGLNPAYTLFSDTQLVLFLKKHLPELNLSYFRPLGNPHKFIQSLLQHFSRLKDENISKEEYLQFAQTIAKKENKSDEEKEECEKTLELAHAYNIFEDIKIQEGVMDFGDLITNCLKLFTMRKHILKQYQEKFSYLLIDEFQDTNYAQNKLAILLAGEKKNITVVADDDQAIYRFRGASVSNIIYFRKDFPNTSIVSLQKNYRSSQEILDSAYTLIQNNNPDRLEVQEHIDKKLIAQRKTKKSRVELIYAKTGEKEIEEIVKKIQDLVKKDGYTYKDIAILVRANDHATPFMKAFDFENIPYQFLGAGQLFTQEIIKDLLSYLKVLINFEDSVALYRLLTMPIFAIDPLDIAKLFSLAKKRNVTPLETLSLDDQTHISDVTKSKLETIKDMMKRHIQDITDKKSAGTILYAFLQDTGLLKKYAQAKTQEEQLEIQTIAKFFDRVKAFEMGNDTTSIYSILDWVDTASLVGDNGTFSDDDFTENNGVNMLTIHASKGLEFPVVFIANLVTQRFPTRQRKDTIPIPIDLVKEVLPVGDYHIQEERRLCYVAQTRAKNKLFLTAAAFYGDGKRERKLSPFIFESIDKKQIEEKTKMDIVEKKHPILLPPVSNETQSTPIQKHHVTYLSYSQIETFDTCPLHYKLKYILGVPTPMTPSLAFGISIHAVLKDFYEQAMHGAIPMQDLDTLMRKHWVNAGYDNKSFEKDAYKTARDQIERYLAKYFNQKSLPLSVELSFQFPVNKILQIGGRIDRIDKNEKGQIEIIDYKTGVNIPTQKEVEKNLQLSMYALALRKMKDKTLQTDPKELLLSLHFLKDDTHITTTRTKEQLDLVEEELIRKAKEIEESDFTCTHTQTCLTCEYKMLCAK